MISTRTDSQRAQILRHLQSGQALTPLEALSRYGCHRLAARVLELRRQGHAIDRQMVARSGKRYAKYKLQ